MVISEIMLCYINLIGGYCRINGSEKTFRVLLGFHQSFVATEPMMGAYFVCRGHSNARACGFSVQEDKKFGSQQRPRRFGSPEVIAKLINCGTLWVFGLPSG